MTAQPIAPRPASDALRLMLAIQRAEAAGFTAFAAALKTLLQQQLAR